MNDFTGKGTVKFEASSELLKQKEIVIEFQPPSQITTSVSHCMAVRKNSILRVTLEAGQVLRHLLAVEVVQVPET